MSVGASESTPVRRVLDTNIVLDLWVFEEPQAEALRTSLESGSTQWLATAAMREELARVLAYPQIAKRLTHRQLPADTVLAHFDRHVQLQPDAPKAPYVCKDADDQIHRPGRAAHRRAAQQRRASALHEKAPGALWRGAEPGHYNPRLTTGTHHEHDRWLGSRRL
jgi:predicted nucleic acid-binding protein